VGISLYLSVKIYNLPDDFDSAEEHGAPVIIRSYRSGVSSRQNKAILHQNMVDIIISGHKSITNVENKTELVAGELMLLAKGNCLISEALPARGLFSNVVLYFTNQVFMDFLIKHQSLLKTDAPKPRTKILSWRQDAFISNYTVSLQLLLDSPAAKSPELRQLKLEELLLYLLTLDAVKLQSLSLAAIDDGDMQLRKAVESNVCNAVTVEDLAFLCNTSLSTFKRKFTRLYRTSPVKWLVEQKIRMAADLLRNPAEKPGLVFEKVGYENHSSFTQAFKQQFKITPKEYQEQKLTF
jgi:AraC family transcriptional regulator, exoenzyme S synthesis regulatory protein ExsA